MDRHELLKRIEVDPERCGGKPCIRGTRIWVSMILDFLATGSTAEQVIAEYPQLKVEDIEACLLFATEKITEHHQARTAGSQFELQKVF
jgi:uncharacterized protein (DUF433 family)